MKTWPRQKFVINRLVFNFWMVRLYDLVVEFICHEYKSSETTELVAREENTTCLLTTYVNTTYSLSCINNYKSKVRRFLKVLYLTGIATN